MPVGVRVSWFAAAALFSDGSVYCWGESDYGQCPGVAGFAPWPMRSPTAWCLDSIEMDLTAGAGTMPDGGLFTWGQAVYGDPVGQPGAFDHNVKLDPPGRLAAYAVGSFVSVTLEDGRTMWSGIMPKGEGLDLVDVQSDGFEPLGSGRAYKVLRAGFSACGLTDEGELDCWGSNAYGRLGNGTTTSDLRAHRVALDGRVVDFDVGLAHACAVIEDGTAFCWGQNDFGILGNPMVTTDISTTPVRVEGLDGVDSVRCGSAGSCALVSGDLWCWGTAIVGSGGALAQQETNFGDVVAFDVGDGAACVVRSDASVWCGGNVAYYAECNGSGDWQPVDFDVEACQI